MNQAQRREAKLLMREFLPEAEDLRTGEFISTILAEEVAKAMNQHEWLDDPDHEIWDLAHNAAVAAEKARPHD